MREVLRPHSHDSADSVDSALESNARGTRAVRISFVALMVTAVAQLGIVTVTGSVALLADTIHNFSDALTAIPLFIAFRLGRRRPTRRYTYGYGRAEDLAGIFVVLMIALSAVVAAWEAFDRLLHHSPCRGCGSCSRQAWSASSATSSSPSSGSVRGRPLAPLRWWPTATTPAPTE